MISINEDFDHFFTTRTADEMTVAGVNAYVDLYANTQVSQLLFCPNGMRAMFRSSSRDALWDGVDESTLAPNFARFIKNTRLLHERGIDVYAAFLARARDHSISPWLTMRMNDVHFTEHPDLFIHSTFWKQHPEYRRVPWSVHAYADRALDYAIDAVRDHALAFIGELFERYDMDGLELDWMRFVYHFQPGREREGGKMLTRFLRTVRGMADAAGRKRGHRIQLAARLPAQPQTARSLGLDGVEWAKLGLIDQLTPSPFFGTSDFNIPVDLWAELLGDARPRVTLAPSMDMSVAASPGVPRRWIDPECVRGFASSVLQRGADRVYLFNYQYMHDHADGRTPASWVKSFRGNLKTVGDAQTLRPLPRRHIVTFTDTAPLGVPTAALLPAELRQNRAYGFLMDLGPAPTAGRATLVVALADRPGVHDTPIEARVNSTLCSGPRDLTPCTTSPGGDIEPGTGMHAVLIPAPEKSRLVAFDIPLDAFVNGDNLVELTVRNEAPQQAVWVEVRIC
ncbi:MAG: hypothetical protein K8S99_13870 [Planctomycetes bacterium]|nr:hypothetical protein [Planctomycetota bacterium]